MNSFRQSIAMFTNRLSACVALVMLAALVLAGPAAKAQTSSGTLDGTVLDQSSAVVPGAEVLLINQASGDVRNAVSNGSGFFTFAAVQPATYTLKITKSGFSTWEAKGLVLSSGDRRTVTEIKLKPGKTEETVVVQGSAAELVPTDSGDKSFTIGQTVMQNVAIIGQNAAEFIKIMPGMAMTAGAINQSSYAASDERTGNGPIGSFSANGQRVAALDITADGAHIIDPGNNGGQAENTNAEMTSEVTVMTSNFGADQAKGPVSINTVGKSGGSQYHGEIYTFNRYYSLNANDWLNNHAGKNAAGQMIAPRPQTKYFYPGGQLSGPLAIPGTSFNHNHDKLFFFVATELYRQNVDNGTYLAVVPTKNMRAGDFTQTDSAYSYTQHLLGSAIQATPVNGAGVSAYTCTAYNGTTCIASKVNSSAIDKNGQILTTIYPVNNADPSVNNGYNYVNSQTRYSNMNQYRGRLDYSISNSTKLYVQYNHQDDNAEESLDTLWTGNAQSWDSPTTPYPSPLVESTDSEVITANMTKVFTPTLTNEVIFNWVYLNLPNKFKDKSKVDWKGLGLNYTTLFTHANQSTMIYPEITGWGDGIANQLNTGFELNDTVYAKKKLPSVADNLTKVWKTHTAKFGFYWEYTWNSQPGNGNVNGTSIWSNWGSNSSGNAYGDMVLGQTTQYNEQNFDVIPEFRYISTEFYAQDSWKAARNLTVDMGLRVSHLGPWVDTTGYGFAAWYPALYAAGKGGSASGVTFPGFEWHKAYSATPLSGAASRVAFYNPRIGFAWDLFGSGKTVLRGGFGIFHYHDEQNVQNPAYSIVQGSFSSPTLWSPILSQMSAQAITSPSGVSALDPNDSQAPRTRDWSVTIAQRAPWKSLLEVSYVGNRSDFLSNYNNNFSQINDIGQNTLFLKSTTSSDKYGWLPDCYPTDANGNPKTTDSGACAASGADTGYTGGAVQDARPYQPYGTVKIINHQMYSNYNSLQATWNKQEGHFIFMMNYTYSKALGIRGENGSASGDPTNLRHNYGTLPNDRRNIFNVAYVYQVPNVKGVSNAIVKQAANGWQLSGITQYQTGADLQGAVSANFGYTAYIPAGTTFMGKTITTAFQGSNSNVLGTSDITLMPKLICDPSKGLKAHQYINGNCFQGYETPGQQGDFIFPTLHGPGYFDTDLSIFKNFVFGKSESKKLQFRFSGYNFLNHPVRSFQNSSDPGLSLQFDPTGNLKQAATGVNFGYANYKSGHRIIQGEAKFSF